MLSNALAYLKKPSTYVILVIGVVLAIAYARFVPGIVKTAASKLPASGA